MVRGLIKRSVLNYWDGNLWTNKQNALPLPLMGKIAGLGNAINISNILLCYKVKLECMNFEMKRVLVGICVFTQTVL